MALKKTHLELLDFSASYSLPYCKQCEEGSDSHVNKVSKTIDIEYTEDNITWEYKPTLYPYRDQHEYSRHTDSHIIWIAWYVC